jgi:hypothetical protein
MVTADSQSLERSSSAGTSVRNTTSPHWRGWLKPESRCLVPVNSFAEYAPEPNPATGKKDVVWFALNDERPLFAFGGFWTEFKGDRGTAESGDIARVEHPVSAERIGTRKFLIAFPQMLANQENMLREYHKDTSAVLFDRLSMPLDNLKASIRLITTMYLTKTVYYSRAIIENVNSRNFLVAFQSMRAMLEVVAAVRHPSGPAPRSENELNSRPTACFFDGLSAQSHEGVSAFAGRGN